MSGTKFREEMWRREVEAWERERDAAVEQRRAEEAGESAESVARVSLAEEDFKQMKGRAMAETQNIDFINPEDFKIPSVVSERGGRRYYTDGSYSVQTGEYSECRNIYMPNGVMRVAEFGELVREELPNGAVREYADKKLRYEKDAEGNYKLYDPKENRIIEEGNKDGWTRKCKKIVQDKDEDGKTPCEYRETLSSGAYKVYKDDGSILEEGTKDGWTRKCLYDYHLGTCKEILPSRDYKIYDIKDGSILEEGDANRYTCYDRDHSVKEIGDYHTRKFKRFDENHRCYMEGKFEEKLTGGIGVVEGIWYKYDEQGNISGIAKDISNKRFLMKKIANGGGEKEIKEFMDRYDKDSLFDASTYLDALWVQEKLHLVVHDLSYKPRKDGSGFYLSGACSDFSSVNAEFIYNENERVAVDITRKWRSCHQHKEKDGECFSKIGDTVIEKYTQSNWQKDGLYQRFNEKGWLERSAEYKEGELHGLYQEYNSDGTVASMKHYKEGKLHGLYQEYNSDGTVASMKHYKEGELHGLYQEYNSDGTVAQTKHYNEGKEDTVLYLAKERVEKRLAKLEGKPKVIQKIAGEITSTKAFNDIALKIATKKVKKDLGK